jgi:hypothetical protein
LDSEDYLKKLSTTNLKNSPKPTPQKFATTNDFADFKKQLEQTMKETMIRLFHNNPIIKQEKTPAKSEIKENEDNTEI